MTWRVLVVLGGISVALLGACGDDDGESANADDSASPTTDEPTTTSTKSGGPPDCMDGARPLDIGGGRVAAVHGDGPSAVVLVNQIEDAPCRWTEFAARVADGGRRVVLWSYGTRDPAERQAAVTAAIDATRADGAEHVVLIGASIGAGYALESAAAANPPIDGVIALSPGAEPGERARQVSGLGSLTAAVLAVASKGDAGSTPAVAQSLLDAAASADEELLALAGDTHGIALVTGPTAAEVLPSVEAFLAAHAPA